MYILKPQRIEYKTEDSRKVITPGHLQDIRSRVRTHEGELLRGEKGRSYMDKYSKKYLGKDLEGSYLKPLK